MNSGITIFIADLEVVAVSNGKLILFDAETDFGVELTIDILKDVDLARKFCKVLYTKASLAGKLLIFPGLFLRTSFIIGGGE